MTALDYNMLAAATVHQSACLLLLTSLLSRKRKMIARVVKKQMRNCKWRIILYESSADSGVGNGRGHWFFKYVLFAWCYEAGDPMFYTFLRMSKTAFEKLLGFLASKEISYLTHNPQFPCGRVPIEAERSRARNDRTDARSYSGMEGAGRLRGSVGDGGRSPDHPSWSPNQIWAPFIVFSTLKIRQLRCKKSNLHENY